MTQAAGSHSQSKFRINGSVVGLILLGVVMIGSLVQVLLNERHYTYPGKKVIRVLHWQLEAGYREALQTAINEYEALHPDVKVEQMAITETVYDQTLNTSLIGKNAPDLAELGKGKFGADDQYTVRYFIPLSNIIRRPNPYNKGTDYENTPWKETFLDGMRGGWRSALQDYYTVPVTLFNMRYFYNKDMYREVTGSDEPPRTFGELIEVGRKVREFGQQRGETITPVVNCYKPEGTVLDPLHIPFTSALEADIDLDLNGEMSAVESYIGYLNGKWNFENPYVQAYFGCLADWTTLFEPGFMGMDRQTALYRFANNKALILTTGSWDAQSIKKQCEGKFEVGVFRFPIPAGNEKWGEYVRGPNTEATATGGGGFGVYKESKHIDVAVDFLMFLTSKQNNGRIMEIASWPPIVAGSKVGPDMKPFIPNPIGYSAKVNFEMTDNVKTVFNGQMAKYLPGEATYEGLAAEYDRAVRDPVSGGDLVWAKQYDTDVRNARSQERLLGVQSMRTLMDPTATDAKEKYEQTLLQQIRGNNGESTRYRFEQVRKKNIPSV